MPRSSDGHRPTARCARSIEPCARTYIYELVPAADGVSLDHRHEGDPINGALARLSEAIARELTQEDKERLRICANDECRWVFRDNSPAGRRKWCDMSELRQPRQGRAPPRAPEAED